MFFVRHKFVGKHIFFNKNAKETINFVPLTSAHLDDRVAVWKFELLGGVVDGEINYKYIYYIYNIQLHAFNVSAIKCTLTTKSGREKKISMTFSAAFYHPFLYTPTAQINSDGVYLFPTEEKNYYPLLGQFIHLIGYKTRRTITLIRLGSF